MEWDDLDTNGKIKLVRKKDKALYDQMRFVIQATRALGEKSYEGGSRIVRQLCLEQYGFTFRLDFGNKGVNTVSVDFYDDEVMRVSFTDSWPVYGGALTPEHIAWEASTWQTELTEVMEHAEVPSPKIPDRYHQLFSYASFIAEATLRLGKARAPSSLFDQKQEYELDMLARNHFKFKVSTQDGRTFVGAKYGIDVPVVQAAFDEAWPMSSSDFTKQFICWRRKDWQNHLEFIIPIIRRDCNRRQLPAHTDLEARAQQYGLLEMTLS